MKTYLVISGSNHEHSYICNAESDIEAAGFAFSRARMDDDHYIVYDHDYNKSEVSSEQVRQHARNVSTASSGEVA